MKIDKLICIETDKICYLTQRSALDSIAKLKQLNKGKKWKSPVREYLCPSCGYHHLASDRREKARPATGIVDQSEIDKRLQDLCFKNKSIHLPHEKDSK